MKLFKNQMLQNVLMKINQVIATRIYSLSKEFEIKALTSNVDYVEYGLNSNLEN